jgi:hypothetical protein
MCHDAVCSFTNVQHERRSNNSHTSSGSYEGCGNKRKYAEIREAHTIKIIACADVTAILDRRTLKELYPSRGVSLTWKGGPHAAIFPALKPLAPPELLYCSHRANHRNTTGTMTDAR